jgi:hypothetical protein
MANPHRQRSRAMQMEVDRLRAGDLAEAPHRTKPLSIEPALLRAGFDIAAMCWSGLRSGIGTATSPSRSTSLPVKSNRASTP